MERFKTISVSDGSYEITIDPVDADNDLMVYIFDMIDEEEICIFLKPDEARELVNVLLEAIEP